MLFELEDMVLYLFNSELDFLLCPLKASLNVDILSFRKSVSFLMSFRLNGLLSAKLVNYELSIELLIKLRSCVLIWDRFKLTCRMSFCRTESLNFIATCLFSSYLNFIKLFISSVSMVEN